MPKYVVIRDSPPSAGDAAPFKKCVRICAEDSLLRETFDDLFQCHRFFRDCRYAPDVVSLADADGRQDENSNGGVAPFYVPAAEFGGR